MRKIIDSLRVNFSKEIEELRKSHSEWTNTIIEMKYTMEGMNDRLPQVEEKMR